MRPASYSLRLTAGFRVARVRVRAPLRWLSREEARRTRGFRARAPCRAGRDRSTQYGKALHRRDASFLRRKTVVRRASFGLQCTADLSVARAHAPLHCLSLGRKQNTLASRARAPFGAGYDSLMPYRRALHKQEASPRRCRTVVRHANCGLQPTADFYVATALPVSREEAQHARLPRARAVPRWL